MRSQTGYRGFQLRIEELLREMGISPHYGKERGLSPQVEATDLVDIGLDIQKRSQRLIPAAALAWIKMQRAAAQAGVTLHHISAFRSVTYQKRIIERKLALGKTLDEILKVNAAPGFSEHHTGRAIDICTPGSEPLTESFEKTNAFDWLYRNAIRYHFTLSYPRSNPHAIIYEPWHWFYQPRR